MQEPALPPDESVRLATLRSLQLLDTLPEERFDRLTRLARRMFNVPIALVSLVDADRQWFKSCLGLNASETPRNISFCGHAILGDGALIVPDALEDVRFADNPLVTGEPRIRFYAGAPLSAPNGARLGTLCVIDQRPRLFPREDLDLLVDLSRMVEQEIAAIERASLDELTGLSNRRGFEALAGHALAVCRRVGWPATLLFMDLDDFKAINDTLGHAAGDRALRDFAEQLLASFRESDVVGRLGGDEFVVLATGTASRKAEICLTRLQAGVAHRNAAASDGSRLAYSVGAVDFDPAKHPSIASLLAEADAHMYQAKTARRHPAG